MRKLSIVAAVFALSFALACAGPGPDPNPKKDKGGQKKDKGGKKKDAGAPQKDEGIQDSNIPVVDTLPPDAPICPKSDACLWTCGNGIMEGDEECDKFDFGGQTCGDFGYKGGPLKCNKYCKLSTWWCIPHGCGNGTIGAKEQCDGKNLNGKTCKSLGYQGGTLGCYSNCKWDVAGCQTCGDGLITGNEKCEPGQKITNKTCKELGYKGGTITCNPKTCQYWGWYCIPWGCGNGVLNAGEQCDGTNLAGKTCKSFGYDFGPLSCTNYCKFNKSQCEHCKCGDGWVGGWEDCDKNDLDGKTCKDLGYDGGTLACLSNCAFDTKSCVKCGDGVLNGTEECEGTDLGGKTCNSVGFHDGTLACDPFCKLNKSGCSNCGNGKVNKGEQCDGNDLNKQTCVKQGYHYGKLACKSGCTFDTSACKKYGCGDGKVTIGEQCDGANLSGKTCNKLGFHSGTLGCKTNCKFDTAKCTNCGNGKVNSGEQCDGAALGGKTCKSVGYTDGTLKCKSNCALDSSGCYKCGDWKINASEQCDGPSLAGKTCKNFGYYAGALKCDANCKYSTSKCNNCGNATVDSGEQCDGTNFGGQSCQSMGYFKGTLTCSKCRLYAYGCTSCGNGLLDGKEHCDGTNLGLSTCKSLGYHSGTLSCKSNCAFNKSGCTNCGNGKVEYGEQCDGAAHGGKTCVSYGFDGGALGCQTGCKVVTTGCWKTKTVGDDTFAQFSKGSATEAGTKLFIAAGGNLQLLDRLDLNGDGYLDLVFGNRFNGVSSNLNSYIYWGSKTGFSNKNRHQLPTKGGVGNSAADLNGDGHLDLVFSNHDDAKKKGNTFVYHQYNVNSYVYWGSGSGYQAANRTELPTSGATGNSVADLNGDGYLDIVSSNSYDGAKNLINSYIYWGSASGYSTAKRTGLPTMGSPGEYPGPRNAVADLNGDGHLDIVFSNWSDGTTVAVNSYVYWGSATGFSAGNRAELPTSAAAGVSVADLNGDGNLDIVFSNFRGAAGTKVDSYVYWGSKTGFSASNRTSLPTVGASGVSVADLNADGNLDIVFSNHSDGKKKKVDSYIYWGAKAGFSVSNRTSLPTIGAGGNLVADFNGDGHLDVAFANQDDGKSWAVTSYVYWGSSSGFSTSNRASVPTVGGAGVLMAQDMGGAFSRGATQKFVSRVLDTGLTAPVFHDLSMAAKVPAKTSLKVQVRSASSILGLATATWYGPTKAGGHYTTGATLNSVHQGHQYLQYRVELSNDFGSTPVLDSVAVKYH